MYHNDMNLENGMIVNDSCREPEMDPVYYCDLCGEPIYEGDTIYKILGNKVCEGCIEDSKEFAR